MIKKSLLFLLVGVLAFSSISAFAIALDPGETGQAFYVKSGIDGNLTQDVTYNGTGNHKNYTGVDIVGDTDVYLSAEFEGNTYVQAEIVDVWFINAYDEYGNWLRYQVGVEVNYSSTYNGDEVNIGNVKYIHLENGSITVDEGDTFNLNSSTRIKIGELDEHSSTIYGTGGDRLSTGTHLHMDMRNDADGLTIYDDLRPVSTYSIIYEK